MLNVWTPRLDTERRGVMVRLHGGAFTTGSGSWSESDGASLADKGDIVVVTVNHRINGLGFLQLDHLDNRFSESGNAGMLDLVRCSNGCAPTSRSSVVIPRMSRSSVGRVVELKSAY